mmetsp:Transcript_26137/g.49429  ORF Transcript_26137/g.49429 Transcript_26137/m.49429 type:complete len:362 (+) Transcript_26137:128-1213(+)
MEVSIKQISQLPLSPLCVRPNSPITNVNHDDDDDDDYIVMAPYRGGDGGDEMHEGISQEQEVEQMEELVRSLKQARLSRENSKVDDDDEEEEEEEVLVGGGKGLMMPKGTYEDDVEEPPPYSPPRGKKAAAPFSSPVSSPPPPGVALEIDMSPSISKDKQALMEKKREAMRKKQEDRAKARDDAKRKAKQEAEQKERDEIIANMRKLGKKKEEEEVREPPTRASRVAHASPGLPPRSSKKGWATGANDKAVVLQTLRSKADMGDGVRASPQPVPKAVQRRLSKKSEGEEGINTLVGRLEKMKQGFAANPPISMDSPKFRLRRESADDRGGGGGKERRGSDNGGGGRADNVNNPKNPFAALL